MDEKQSPNEEQEPSDELSRKMSQWQQANPQATLTEIELSDEEMLYLEDLYRPHQILGHS